MGQAWSDAVGRGREADMQVYQASMKHWSATIHEVEEYELGEWRRLTPGPCRLAIYWVQMLLCLAEAPGRCAFHAVAWCLAMVMATLELVWLTRCFTQSAVATTDIQTAESAARRPEQEPLWKRQVSHHLFWFQAYALHLPRMIFYNLRNPCCPFFADGADITVYRPVPPTAPVSNTFEDCCGKICASCLTGCMECGHTLEVISIRYLRSSFLSLGGYHALQCGTCLGPCIRPICYDPFVGDDTESGRCAPCEVDAIRIQRWIREAHAAKAARSRAFYEQRPGLLRPPLYMLEAPPGSPKCPSASDDPRTPLLEPPKQQALAGFPEEVKRR